MPLIINVDVFTYFYFALQVVFDTGSSTLEVPGISCESCKDQKSFDPSLSSTFVNGTQSAIITFGTGVGVTPVIGDNTQLGIQSAMDTVAIGDLSVTNASFFLITFQTLVFSIDPFDGIMGLGTDAQSWLAGAINKGLSREPISPNSRGVLC